MRSACWNRGSAGLYFFRRIISCAMLFSVAATCGCKSPRACRVMRSEEHTSELQSQSNLVCRLLLEKQNIALKYVPTSPPDKVKEKRLNAFPVRLSVVENLIAARSTSQMIYHAKNHDVTTRSKHIQS